MPRFAHIAEIVPCPTCGADLALNDRVGFQWGYCAYAWSDSSRPSYRIGDALLWRADVHGRVPAWRYFHDGTANIGDPHVGDVLVRESEFNPRECRSCGRAFGGIGVVIRAGRICAISTDHERPPEVDVFVGGPDDEWIARPDWNDPPMRTGAPGGPHAHLLPTSEARTVVDPA